MGGQVGFDNFICLLILLFIKSSLFQALLSIIQKQLAICAFLTEIMKKHGQVAICSRKDFYNASLHKPHGNAAQSGYILGS